VGVEQLEGADTHLIEAVQQPEVSKFLDGVRQRVDADAELADRFRLLEHLAVEPAGMQHERGRQSADPATNDDRLHGFHSTHYSWTERIMRAGTQRAQGRSSVKVTAGPVPLRPPGRLRRARF